MDKKLFNLKISQGRLFAQEIFYKNTSINNIAGNLHIDEPVDFDALKESLNRIIRDHDGLRSQITLENNKPQQYEVSFIPKDFEIMDFENEEQLREFSNSKAKTPFGNIFDSELYDFTIFKLPNGHGGVVLKFHHLIIDGASYGALVKYLIDEYDNMKNGNLDYEGPKTSYFKSIEIENEYINSEKYNITEKHFNKLLSESPETIDVSGNGGKVSLDPSAERKIFTISKEVVDSLNSFAKSISLFTSTNHFLSEMYATYFSRLNNYKDTFFISVPTLGRNPNVEHTVIGPYMNVLPVKFSLNYENSIKSNIAKASTSFITTLMHQEFSVQNNPANNILISNLFTLPKISTIPIRVTEEFQGTIPNSLQIRFDDKDSTGELNIQYDYRTSDFDEKKIEEIHNRVMHLVTQALESPEKPLKNLSILTKDEENTIVYEFNNTFLEYDLSETPIEWLEKQVQKTPDKIALKDEYESRTYRQFYQNVCNIAGALIEQGVQNNDVVSLYVPRGIKMVEAQIGTLKAGAAYQPINLDEKKCPPKVRDGILEEVHPKCILTTAEHMDKFVNYPTLDINTVSNTLYDKKIDVKYSPDDLAYILFTSGTTGKPKGTKITNKNIVGAVKALEQLIPTSEEDVATLWHDYFFDISQQEMYNTLLHGATLIVLSERERKDPRKILEISKREGVTIFQQMPSSFYETVNCENLTIDSDLSWKYVILIGEPVQSKNLLPLASKYPDMIFVNQYGPTETTWIATHSIITMEQMKKGEVDIGRPLPNYTIYILDKYLKPVPVGHWGEIYIGGIGVGDGYLNRPDLTNQKFIDSPFVKDEKIYATGDLGNYLEGGTIICGGRTDDQIKINDQRVELKGIVNKMIDYGLKNPIVFKVPEDIVGSDVLAGFYLIDEDNQIDEKLLRSFLSEELASYEVPRILQGVTEYPETASGKVDKNALIKMLKEHADMRTNTRNQRQEILLPKTVMELRISNILKKYNQLPFSTDDIISTIVDSMNTINVLLDLIAEKLIDYDYGLDTQDIADSTIISLANHLENKIQIDMANAICGISKNELKTTKIANIPYTPNLKGILLTGSTGYLGSYMLREFINNPDVEKIYCLIRSKDNKSASKRLIETYKNYSFTEDICSLIEIGRVIPFEGDLAYEHFNVTPEMYNELSNNVTTVVHTAANVRHLGDKNIIYRDNVTCTQSLIRFCINNNIHLSHSSTTSLAGGLNPNDSILTKPWIFDENSFYEHEQDLYNNIYFTTKLIADYEVLKAINEEGLHATIFRYGNMMPSMESGTFQLNADENGFISRLKGINKLRAIPEGYLNSQNIDLSPIDICSKATAGILKTSGNQTVYHILNPNKLDLSKLFGAMNFAVISNDDFIKMVSTSSDPDVKIFMNYLRMFKSVENTVVCDATISKLESLGCIWNNYDIQYLQKISNLINNSKFNIENTEVRGNCCRGDE